MSPNTFFKCSYLISFPLILNIGRRRTSTGSLAQFAGIVSPLDAAAELAPLARAEQLHQILVAQVKKLVEVLDQTSTFTGGSPGYVPCPAARNAAQDN